MHANMTRTFIVLCVIPFSCLHAQNTLAQSFEFPEDNTVPPRTKSVGTDSAFIKMDTQEPIAVVSISITQREHLAKVLASALKVIEEGVSLESQELALGRGEYSWPKDRKKPTKVSINFTSKNFEMRSISINFSRKDQANSWSKAEILVVPANFPKGVYSQNLPSEILKDFVFDKSYVAELEHGPIKRANAFEYKRKSHGDNLRLYIEARSDVSTLDDDPPKSFYLLIITKA